MEVISRGSVVVLPSSMLITSEFRRGERKFFKFFRVIVRANDAFLLSFQNDLRTFVSRKYNLIGNLSYIGRGYNLTSSERPR